MELPLCSKTRMGIKIVTLPQNFPSYQAKSYIVILDTRDFKVAP